MTEMNIIQAVNNALHLAFEKDPKVLCFGEDVGYFGGVFRATQGLQEKYGEERCFDTPICEQGIAGFAMGLAQKGFKPVAEIQFADYIFPAYDQIVNEIAKSRYRSGNLFPCPLVIRTPYGGGIHGGLYHSQSPEAQFLHTPGLKVIIPADPYEAKGLLLSAIKSEDPVLFFEPKRIYRASKGDVPEEYYEIPLGEARITKKGSHITLIGYGAQHHQNMEAANELMKKHNIEVEVIDLRTLNPIDINTITESVKKTGKCVIAHEAPKTMGFGAELAALIAERCFLYLEAPIGRCCGYDIPFPNTHEKQYMPDAHRVVKTILDTIHF
jgi:2-oxoisovalerate dehydrogenase E1 component beta subunit